MSVATLSKPILLFDSECAVCRRIGGWVKRSSEKQLGGASIQERPIGNDPDELRKLNPSLDIWDAYAVVHVLMPDGSMKEGGDAIAEVLHHLPKFRWLAWSFDVRIFGVKPFQEMLDLAYAVLSNVRPLFGCKSCGTPRGWRKPIWKSANWIRSLFAKPPKQPRTEHFTPVSRAKDKAQDEPKKR